MVRDRRTEPAVLLRKEITLRHAVALYVSSVLGSGVLVLPGLAANFAGPASLIAWVALSVASYPFAYTFASLSARRPESGGVYAFAKEAFGLHVATVTGWLFALWFITGAPAVTLIAASYVGFALPLTSGETFAVAACIIVVAFLVNYRGIVFSNRVQLAIVGTIVALLLSAVAVSSGAVRLASFTPLAPHGYLAIGTAAALIFWSYLGYENVSNVAEEFRDPERDFMRSIAISVILVGVLYTAVAFVTVGTLAYEAGGSVAPFAAIFAKVLGHYGRVGTAVLAVFIIFGASNAYTAGMSRVLYAVARDRGLPQAFDHVNARTGIPDRSLMLLSGSALVMVAVYYLLHVDLKTALLIPSGAAILVYIVGSAAGVRLLRDRGAKRALPWISLAMSVAVLPFLGALSLAALLTGAAALLYSRFARPRATSSQVDAPGSALTTRASDRDP